VPLLACPAVLCNAIRRKPTANSDIGHCWTSQQWHPTIDCGTSYASLNGIGLRGRGSGNSEHLFPGP
jgi:hypothetical protein